MPERLGSLNEYIQANKGASPEDYGRALDQLRDSIAAEVGVTKDEIHAMGPLAVRAALETKSPEPSLGAQ
jgi:hypothetical protein